MDFVDEETRPRFFVQSRPSVSSSPNLNAPPKVSKLHAVVCVSSGALLLFAAVSLAGARPLLSSLLFWTSFSLFAGPFAPPSLTGGDVRVGVGPPIPDASLDPDPDPNPPPGAPTRRIRTPLPAPVTASVVASRSEKKQEEAVLNGGKANKIVEREWTEADLEFLKKQITKHPVGEPRRWERIQEAFQGRHGLESVIKMGKSLSEKKPGDTDSYERFLKQRKPVDQRVGAVAAAQNGGEEEAAAYGRSDARGWSSGEDLALLNALKAFPKEVAMRWEKVTAAVPGRSKAECMKRVTELKRDFRNSKASQT